VSESYIQLPPDGTGKKVRALKRTVNGNEVYEEAYVIVDPSTGEPITPLKEGGNVNVANLPSDYLKEGGNVNVANLPSDYPLPSSQISDLKNVTVNNMPTDYAKAGQLPSSLTSGGNFKVALQEDNVGLLKEGGNVNISNLPSNYPLPSSQVSDLKNVTVNNMPTDYLKEGGNVNVGNLPSNYPLPASQVSDLKNVNVGNFPSDYPDSGANTKLNNIYSKLNSQLDVTLTVLSRLIRYGRNVSPSWVHGNEVAAPSANTSLVSHTVSGGKHGLIYGFYVSSDEENVFKIMWVSGGVTRSIRIVFGGGGTIHYVDFFAMNEGQPADSGTEIKIVNVNAGGSGKIYQARLFIAEV